VNPYAADAQPGFYAQLALETGAFSIVDLGCGTGLITCELARRGYRMTGVDPVCGMQVRTSNAPARVRHHDDVEYFCSDHCRERFEADPSRFAEPRIKE